MNKAIDIAKYIINYANDNQYEISNLKLQKLLYYTQAAFLVKSGGDMLCFPDKIVAWLHGPVVQNVYYHFSGCGGGQIPRQDYIRRIVYKNQRLEFENSPFTDDILTVEERGTVNQVLSGLLPYSAWELVARTHEETPWLAVHDRLNMEITAKSIWDYFNEADNRGRIYGNFNQ